MNEEEKEAIENLKGTYWYVGEEGLEENIKIILNLIEKQQKEIGKEKEKNKELTDEYLIQRNLINAEFLNENYISKDKINSKIAEYEEILQSSIIKEDYKKEVEHIIRVLEELKGE